MSHVGVESYRQAWREHEEMRMELLTPADISKVLSPNIVPRESNNNNNKDPIARSRLQWLEKETKRLESMQQREYCQEKASPEIAASLPYKISLREGSSSPSISSPQSASQLQKDFQWRQLSATLRNDQISQLHYFDQ